MQEKTKKKFYPNIKKSLMFYKGNIRRLTVFIIFTILGAVIAMFSPIFSANLIVAITELNYVDMMRFVCFVGIAHVTSTIFYFVANVFYNLLTKNVLLNIKAKLSDRMLSLETKNYDKYNTGMFITRMDSDAGSISTIFTTLFEALADVFANFGFLIYIAFLNIYLFLYFVLTVIIIFIFQRIRMKFWYKAFKELKKKNDVIVGQYNELIRGVRDAKSLFLKNAALRKVNSFQKEYMKENTTVNIKVRAFYVIETIISALNYIALIAISIVLLKNNIITLATLLICINYRPQINGFISYIMHVQERLTSAELACERVIELFDETKYPVERFGSETLKNIKGKIEFKNVSFSYNDEQQLFENLSFAIKPNSTVALVGKSGQGKSTILSLINRLYDYQSGSIKIDGVEIKKLTEQSLRDNIALVMQSPYIFNTNIKDNLLLVKPDATDDEIVAACKNAQIDEYFKTLPEQYNSLVGENGVILSGGQKQRLAIARALLKNSKIILFDEATSALDNESQDAIKKVLDDLKRDHTVVIVAHRLSTIVDCDNIFLLDGSKIMAEGTHAELLKTSDIYKDLYAKEITE